MEKKEEPKSKIGGGLKDLPEDKRDFSLGGVFGYADLVELPENFVTSPPLKIKDQFDTDLCTAFALTAVSEDQEGVELNPEYQFAKTKQIQGEYESWGANLRDACKSAVKYGSIEQDDAIYKIDVNSREKVANWLNYPDFLDDVAKLHLKQSFFRADTGPYDTFDNIRSALWINREEKRSVLTGSLWYVEWTDAEKGLVPLDSKLKLFGHAFKVFGWKTLIEGAKRVPFLMAQLSNGTKIGDEGIFYFRREVVNKEFKQGAYMLKDMTPEKARYYLENGIKSTDNWVIQQLKVLWRFILDLFVV